jgi:uncharacterized coiled-coil DUF342 family protein
VRRAEQVRPEIYIAKFLYHPYLGIMKLAASEGENRDMDHLGWDDLVTRKRMMSNDLKSITDKIVDIDRNQLPQLSSEIRERRSQLDRIGERIRQIGAEVQKNNGDLLSVSEKITQSKNFLSVMESRMPSESEETLVKLTEESQKTLDAGAFKNERERNEVLSRLKEAAMKLEAIKATRVIRDQLSQLTQESSRINNAIQQLDVERESARAMIAQTNSELDELYDRKRKTSSERENHLLEYDKIVKEFDAVNVRLDAMAEMRKKQRQEYGHGLPSDALFKVKETARKKLESGGKLSFDELKLLYEEKD